MKKSAIFIAFLALLLLCGCHRRQEGGSLPQPTGSMTLDYAKQFTVDYYGGDALVTIGGADRYLILDGSGDPPDGFDGAVLIRKPAQSIYLAASSVMDFFRQLDALDRVRLTSTKLGDWSIQQVKDAMDAGKLLYAGRYAAPDYELILSDNTDLAIESTMIYHSPDTQERLTRIGIPVLVDRSSYETDPLGRMEWIKLYGLITGRLDEAVGFFDGQVEEIRDIIDAEYSGSPPKVAFFYINSTGQVIARKSDDYIAELIEMAGGEYVMDSALDGDNNLSTSAMEFEAFYTIAKDADIIIYNSAIDGDITSIEQLLEKNSLLADFKAVKTGNVWCTSHSVYQETTAAAGLLKDLRAVVSGEADGELRFIHSVE
jgi:iron complex transport system substrate-binding protein